MIGIIGAMAQEVALLRQQMQNPQTVTLGGMTFWTGLLEQKSVVLLQCGIGKVNAAIGTALLIDHFQVQAVINTGSAGGLLANQTFGDMVISEAVVHHDVNVTIFGYEPGQVPGLPARFSADPALIDVAEKGVQRLREQQILAATMQVSRGLVGSGDVFMHEASRIAQVKQDFPTLCAVEMEGAAIAQTCHLFAVPFVIIRSLSDIAGKESPMKFEEFLPLASANSAHLVMEMVRNWAND